MYLDNSRGSAFIAAIMAVLIVLTLGLGVLSMATSEGKISNNHLKSTQAFYIAEAGIAEAVSVLLDNPDAPEGEIINKTIGAGTAVVNLDWSGNIATLTSVGRVGETKRTVTEKVKVIAQSAFKSAITSFQGSNGWFTIGNNIEIDGDISTGVGITIGNNVNIDGLIYSNREQWVAPIYQDKLIVDEDLALPEFPELPEIPAWQKPGDLGTPVVYGYVNDADKFATGAKYYQAGTVILDKGLELNGVYIECTYLSLPMNHKYSGITFDLTGSSGSISVGQKTELNNVNLISDSITISNNVVIRNATVQGKTITVGNGAVLENVKLLAKTSVNIGNNSVMKNATIQGKTITIGNNVLLENVKILAESSVTIGTSDSKPKKPEDIPNVGYIISNGTITLGNFSLRGYILSHSQLTVSNNSFIVGAIGAGGLTIGNNTEIIASNNTGAPVPPFMGGVEITKQSWSEGMVSQ